MLLFRKGDRDAFEELFGRHHRKVVHFCFRMTGDRARAEEAAQEVFLRIARAAPTYEPTAKFTTWLYTIAHNRLMDHFRAAGRASFASYDDPDDDPIAELPARDPPPEDLLSRKREAARLLAAIDALPAAQREAFLLQQEGDLSVEAIAAATGVTRETAKSRLRYALAKLRASLRPQAANEETMGDHEESR